ncbi:MAG: hypothetical protein QOG79_6919, partial [Mycobacterium sp.]|nr:hypothetical protein [Mycobacterium sp.]
LQRNSGNTYSRRTSMTTKLAGLITWVAEILDRNLIMVPELDEP